VKKFSKVDIWYFFNFTINPKVQFLKKLNLKIPGWLLCQHSKTNGKIVFGLTPTWGPLLCGDEIGINDPIISINNIKDAYYGFNGGLSSVDAKKVIPNDIREWKKIWDKAIKAHHIVRKGNIEVRCPDCSDRYGFGTGLNHNGHLCPSCFGLGYLYTYGPQQELGKILLEGLDITIVNHKIQSIKFQSNGLNALISLYHTYHTGIVTDLTQGYVAMNCSSILNEVFPNIVILKIEDEKEEEGWSFFYYDQNGKQKIRHLYVITKKNEFINLFTGKEEVLSQQAVPAQLPEDLPGEDSMNLKIDLLYNLCKYAV